jgi:hypothetical protein
MAARKSAKGKGSGKASKAKAKPGRTAVAKAAATKKRAGVAKKSKPPKKASTAKAAKQAAAPKKAKAAGRSAPSIHRPPLPELVRHTFEWRGTDVLPAWAGLRFYSKWMKRKPKPSDGTVHVCVEIEGDDATEPTASQIATYAFLKDNERALADAVLARILAEYPEAKRAYTESVDDTWPALPDVMDVAGLGAVIGPPTIHVYSNEKGGLGGIGFAFDCAWDEEHQLSVSTLGTEVLEIGDGSVAGHIVE